MWVRNLLVGLVSLSGSVLAARSSRMEVFERVATLPAGWVKGERPSASHLMKFKIGVHTEQAKDFEQMVIDMSTPDHPTYGQHLDTAQLKDLVRPSIDTSFAVLDWLANAGVPKQAIEDDGDWVSFIVPLSQAETMLNTQFHYYTHMPTQVKRIRTTEYSLPSSLHSAIDMIQPTIYFGAVRRQSIDTHSFTQSNVVDAPTDFNATFCNSTVTPACLRGLYQLGNFTSNDVKGNSLGISGYLEELGRFSDLALFDANLAQYAIGDNFTVVSLNNGTTDQASTASSGEANLDVQYAMALSYKTKTTFYSTGGLGELIPDLDQPDPSNNQNEPYLEQLTYFRNLPDDQLPKVVSTSYGEDEQSVPESYTSRACNLFAQLGSRGVSFIFSSGDTGVGSACQTNDGKNTTRFLPVWPAACPFVTSVGATQRVEPEFAVSFSSGGFSDRFPRPSYQDAAVTAFLAQIGDNFKGLYNPAGRGFPDVAAQGVGFLIYDKGTQGRASGTSCSAPTFAGLVTSLNAIRLSTGKPTLGFLNPWLYSVGYKGLTDIVNGKSTGCTGVDEYSGLKTPIVPGASWNATPGWDPVTGYGTPVFPRLVALLPTHE